MKKTATGTTELAEAALAHLDALYSFAMTLTHDPGESEDLVQDTYLRAVDNRHRFSPDTHLKAWLFTILRNLWLNRLRRRTQGPAFAELDQETVENLAGGINDDPQVLYLREAERNAVRLALARLPWEFREIVVLRDMEDFSYREIAEMLDCPVGTVMSRLARAREKLRALLNEQSPRSRVKTMQDEAP
jgi:RNA polymerase sigma-70 factor (ECF subfamily)